MILPKGKLRIGHDGKRFFDLPIDFVTETSAILARRGAGKTYTAHVLAEELLRAKQQIIAIDPTDAWWGLRSSASGKRKGFQIVIFGGPHGDMPLHEGMAIELANLVTSNRALSCVLSLKHLRKNKQRQFVMEFAEHLYHLRGEQDSPVHIFIDEADTFVPQHVYRGMERMVGAIEDIVRKGRKFGLGVTMITQRPAVLNKDVLTQAEILIAGQVTGPQDKKAVKAWIEDNASEMKQKDFIASLALLQPGTLWFWSPAWLRTLAKVKVRIKTTFNSSATPKAGQKLKTPKKAAKIDLSAIKKKLEKSVKIIEQTDPKMLKHRIAELERELRKKRPAFTPVSSRKSTQVDAKRIAEERDRYWQRQVSKMQQEVRQTLAGWGLKLAKRIQHSLETAVVEMRARLFKNEKKLKPPSLPKTKQRKSLPSSPMVKPRLATTRQAKASTWEEPGTESAKLGKCERAILTVLAQRERPSSIRLVAVQAGYSVKSGSFNNSLSRLRSAGYTEGGKDSLRITQEGVEVLGSYDPLPSGDELIAYWQGQLPKCAKAAFSVLAEVYPDGLPKEEVAERTGYAVTSGSFNNSLSRLRTLELVEGRGELKLREELFE